MAARKITWTSKANLERKNILEYWVNRNKSTVFSIKLNNLFIDAVKKLAKKPMIGRKTNFENVHVKIVREYLLFYEFSDETLNVLAVWDGRRDENKLKIK